MIFSTFCRVLFFKYKGTGPPKKSGIFSGVNNKGFTLFELLIVLALIALLSAIVIPNLPKATLRYEREKFISRLNALVKLGWQQAVIQYKVHQVSFDIGKDRVLLSIDSGRRDRNNDPIFEPVKGLYLSTSFEIPNQFRIKQFFIEGFDEMSRFVGKKTAEVWFYIVPEGMTQDVVINLIDLKDLKNGKPRQVGLVLNPFNAQFKIYDTFQKP